MITSLLPYVNGLAERDTGAIDLVVLHCTELPNLAAARDYGERIHHEDSATGNSGHYYIDRDGSTHRWVPHDRVAHHVKHYNLRSIGIELVNRGRWPNWFDSASQQMTEPYPSEQTEALIGLLRQLRANIPSLRWIVGHEQLDQSRIEASDLPGQTVRRKLDPGPKFPWQVVLSSAGLEPFPQREPI